MLFRPERTISRKVLVRYSMALLFPLLHLGMKLVHVVQVVVFVVALLDDQLLQSNSLLLDQPVVAVGVVCPEECSAAEMVCYILYVILHFTFLFISPVPADESMPPIRIPKFFDDLGGLLAIPDVEIDCLLFLFLGVLCQNPFPP